MQSAGKQLHCRFPKTWGEVFDQLPPRDFMALKTIFMAPNIDTRCFARGGLWCKD
jgi:hypothetical protein